MRRSNSNVWLYCKIVILNMAAALMFFSINQNPPSVIDLGMVYSKHSTLEQKDKSFPLVISGIPRQLIIPNLGLDLVVDVGSYDPSNGSWSIGTDRAYYADVSAPVNNIVGTTLIYGHARHSVFGELHNIQLNATAIVYSSSGYVFRYSYQSTEQVYPTDTSVFQQNGQPTLVLQTCAGPLDAYRALFTFKFESVEKI